MVKQIPVGDQMATVDDEDFERLSKIKWSLDRKRRIGGPDLLYARGYLGWKGGKAVRVFMHRMVLGCEGPIDHVDGNGLTNTRANLRPADDSQNQANRRLLLSDASSRFRGVCWNKQSKKWQAGIKVRGRSFHLGLFAHEEDAARAYDVAAVVHFGEFANPNFGTEAIG